jgi:hypothetical protein
MTSLSMISSSSAAQSSSSSQAPRAPYACSSNRARSHHRRRGGRKKAVAMRAEASGKKKRGDYPNLYTPQDGELAERKASRTLKRLFTYVAIRVVQSHLEGQGNDGGFAPQATGLNYATGKTEIQSPDYNDLRNAMEGVELGDGDSWIREFAKTNPAVTLRILEARKAYCDEFDYEMLEEMTNIDVMKSNTELMTEVMNRSYNKNVH